jgi:AAA15 family ATPase/GTPase
MSIKSIKIKNLLSFDELIIDNFEDINCIVGKNNAGKSNLLKLLRFFYARLEGKRELPPKLYSNYSAFGTIKITYSISSRVNQHLKNKDKNYFPNEADLLGEQESIYELTLKIYSNDSIEWSTKNKDILKTINYLYPFFDIEARHIDLYNWDKLWDIISSLKSFNLQKLEENLFYKEKKENEEFDNFIKLINSSLDTKKYSYGSKLLSFIKARIQGDRFTIGEDDLTTQSDGTNAHKFIESSLKLLLVLTKREYITPIIYIDEPEIGLHPKKNEELIESIYDTYLKQKRNEPYPTIIFATHSPNIVKQVIKLFNKNQQILHFSKKNLLHDIKKKYVKLIKK